uniref:(northern house mosquito) hypothetical protein n=1 Tax=Culex pipiens TaxID=7175 RepID=A0A8D8ESU2_CULPI
MEELVELADRDSRRSTIQMCRTVSGGWGDGFFCVFGGGIKVGVICSGNVSRCAQESGVLPEPRREAAVHVRVVDSAVHHRVSGEAADAERDLQLVPEHVLLLPPERRNVEGNDESALKKVHT